MKLIGIIKPILQLGIIPTGWLTILSGFATLLIGTGSLIYSATGLGETALTVEQSVALITTGAAAIGLGRRKK